MANIKVSELTQTASVENTDLIEVSRYLGPGSWESRSMTIKTLNTSVSGSRVVIVSKSGTGDSLTVEGGLAIAAGLTPTQANPVVVQIMTGYYVEDNPLIVPNYVAVQGIGGSSAVAIAPSHTNTHVFEMGNFTTLSGVTVQNAHSNGGVGIYVNSSFVTIQDVVIYFCETGILVTGAGHFANLHYVSVLVLPPYVLQDGFLCENGGLINGIGCVVNSIVGPAAAVNGYRATGSTSELYVFSCATIGMSRACYCDDGAKLVATGCVFQRGTNGLYIGSTGTNSGIIACGVDMVNNTAYDVWISNNVAGVVNLNGKYDGWKRFIGTGGTMASTAQDGSINGSRATGRFISEGPVELGYPGFSLTGSDLNLNVGEGASNRYNGYGEEIVEFWSYDASAPSGSKFARYANNAGVQLSGINDAIVVGQVFPYADIRYTVATAANVGSADIVVEYWNGSAWVDTPFATWKRTDFTARLNQPFQNVETQFIEVSNETPDLIIPDYDQLDEIPAWDYADYLYPVRYRNNGAALVSGMVFNTGMTKGDTWTVGISKRQTLFGNYRKTAGEKIVIPASDMDPNPNCPPLPYNANVSSHIQFDYPYSLFTENNVSALSFPISLPWWVDTSTPVEFEIIFAPTNSNVGSVHFDMYYADVYDGVVFDGANPEGHVNFDTNTAGTANLLQVAEASIDIRGQIPGHIYRVNIERDDVTSPDTYEGDVAILRAEVYFTRKMVS